MTGRSPVAYDFETFRFGAGNLAPYPVCCSFAYRHIEGSQPPVCLLWVGEDDINTLIDSWLTDDRYIKVAHNNAFDLAVLCSFRPDLFPRVFQMLMEGQFHCTAIREKLLNLVDTGDLEYMTFQGKSMKIGYSLVDLEKFYLGIDRSEEKKDPAAWRTNYGLMYGQEQWPVEAVEYAKQDAESALLIWEAQEQRRADVWNRTGYDPFAVLAMKTAVDFALYLTSCWGMRVDPVRKAEIEEMLKQELSPEKMALLFEHGLLRPAIPPRPYRNGATNPDGSPKMTQGQPEKKNMARIKAYIEEYAKNNEGIELWRTDTGEVSTKAEWFDEYGMVDPVLSLYRDRQKLQKMVTTEMPRLCTKDEKGNSTGITSEVVHPCFNVVVETGRTSSYGTESYPSLNGQNVDPRARPCIIPRDGWCIFSVDFNQMELGTLGQRCLDLFGFSVLAEKINAGVDVHEFTGAQLAFHLNTDFQTWVLSHYPAPSQDQIWELFHSIKDSNKPFWKHFRTFAKPTNLGYPGGLGPETFITYAKGTFGLTVDKELARRLREIWMQTLPEMEPFFDYIKQNLKDYRNGPRIKVDQKTGKEIKQDLFAYTTPMGLHRAGATFCAAANGSGLQSPSAEGATLALFSVVRACFDRSLGSILSDDSNGPTLRVTNFIHDELLGEVRVDGNETARVNEVSRIMVESMRQITPDVTPRAEACLMNRWYKQAEPVYDSNGNLIPWEPQEN